MWEAVQFVGIPIGLGLIGFVEPCSMGANLIFLTYLRERPAAGRLRHAMTFILSRSLFLGVLGAGVAWAGASFARGTYLYSAGLGGLFILMGLLALGVHFGLVRLPMKDLGIWLREKTGLSLPMGVTFGLSAPICATPLFLALLGQAGVAGVAKGFFSLGLLGFALSAPLLVVAYSQRASELLSRVGRHSRRMTLVAGVVLVLLGLWSVVIGWRGLPT
ncbi:MAG: cytochrome c biogenesis CcdA family protein [Nitrospinota bacterium]